MLPGICVKVKLSWLILNTLRYQLKVKVKTKVNVKVNVKVKVKVKVKLNWLITHCLVR